MLLTRRRVTTWWPAAGVVNSRWRTWGKRIYLVVVALRKKGDKNL